MRNTVFCTFLVSLCLVSVPSSAAEVRRPAVGDTSSTQPPPAKTISTVAAPVDTAKKVVSPAVPAPAKPGTAAASDSALKKDSAAAAAAAVPPAPVPDSASRLVDSTAKASAPDSAAPAATLSYGDSSAQDSAKTQPAGRKKRKRIVRETTVNTIDDLKGSYRSPKKALFMSLIVPGLGQAYVGQHWGNYARGATYFLADVGLALGWRHYVVTKQDRQIRRYRRFADANWRQSKYEDSVGLHRDTKSFDIRNPHRETYCQSVQSNQGSGSRLYSGCLDPDAPQNDANYQAFANAQSDKDLSPESISKVRAEFPNTHNFYELIGKEVEFVTGWSDANDIIHTDSSFTQIRDDKVVTATTELQQEYIGMRAKANDYARMQAYFLGGMVLNHIVSALDAAFAAHFHNKGLYQTEVGFWDRVHLDSYMAWDGFAPRPTVSASLTF